VPLRNGISPGFLFAFLRSEPIFRLLRSTSTGSKQQEQHVTMMRDLPVPRLGSKVEKAIGDRVSAAVGIFDRALQAEARAIALVDQAIEEAT